MDEVYAIRATVDFPRYVQQTGFAADTCNLHLHGERNQLVRMGRMFDHSAVLVPVFRRLQGGPLNIKAELGFTALVYGNVIAFATTCMGVEGEMVMGMERVLRSLSGQPSTRFMEIETAGETAIKWARDPLPACSALDLHRHNRVEGVERMVVSKMLDYLSPPIPPSKNYCTGLGPHMPHLS